MKPWHHGLPETKQFVVFPPLGEEAVFEASKERIVAHLSHAFPCLDFEIARAGLDDEPTVMPVCGTVGGPDSRVLAPPPEHTLREIERALRHFDIRRAALS